MRIRLLALVLLSPPVWAAEPNLPLDPSRFFTLAASCGTGVPADTLNAVARTESALYPYALSVNYPETAARKAGYTAATLGLARQPKDRQEARSWTDWFEQRGYTVSIGLMQINTQTARLYGYAPETLFDPCLNLRLGAVILSSYYRAAHKPGLSAGQALLDALSAYNTGNRAEGYANGYVASILKNRQYPPPLSRPGSPPLPPIAHSLASPTPALKETP